MPRSAFLASLALAGCATGAQTVCDELCNQLVEVCAIPAFPSIESCLQGCGYDADQGADVEGELACVEKAACDEFAIVECEHQYGLE